MWESRVLRRAFERLELHEWRHSHAILRGGGGGDVTSLPDAWVGNHPGLPGAGTVMLLLGPPVRTKRHVQAHQQTVPSMSSPKSSPRGKFSPLHGIPGFRANLPRLESPAGVPGSPVTVRREHQRSSHVAGLVTVVFSFSLPVLPFPLELGLGASAFVRPIRVGTTFYPF